MIALALAAVPLLLASPASAATKVFHGCVSGSAALADHSSNSLALNVPLPKKAKSQLGSISSIKIGTRISHTADADLAVAIVTPDGRAFSLSVSNGGGGDGYGSGAAGCSGSLVLFDESAPTPITTPGNVGNDPIVGSFRPQASFVHLEHSRAIGLWTLLVTDAVAGDVGAINAFSLDITYSYKKSKKKKKK